MTLIIVDTPHWTFMAVGLTPASARTALKEGWKEHCRQTGADLNYLDPRVEGNVYDVHDGECWRDDAVIWRKP